MYQKNANLGHISIYCVTTGLAMVLTSGRRSQMVTTGCFPVISILNIVDQQKMLVCRWTIKKAVEFRFYFYITATYYVRLAWIGLAI